VLEGEAEEQESQETGESDGSCGKSEKLVCLGLNPQWDMWPENFLSVCHPIHAELEWERMNGAVGENERCIGRE